MGIGGAKWREIYGDSAGDVRGAVDVVMQFLPETQAGREFLGKYTEEDGVVSPDRKIFREHVAALLEGLDSENEPRLAKLIRIIRSNVCFILQFNKFDRNSEGGKMTFENYSDSYKRIGDANFFADKFFFTKWFFACSNYAQRREVALKAAENRIVFGVEGFKTLVYDCCDNNIADEVAMFMMEMKFVYDEGFFLFCLDNSRDELSKVRAVIMSYEKITRKHRSELFKVAFSRCGNDADFDWIFSIMRIAEFKLTDQFFIECVEGAGCMTRRVIIHSLHLRRVGFKPSKGFFDAWRGVASGAEVKLVEKYASARG